MSKKIKLQSVTDADIVEETNQPEQESEHIFTLKKFIEQADNIDSIALKQENASLRLQLKMADIQITEMRTDPNFVAASRFAYEYLMEYLGAKYGIGLQDGKIVNLHTGVEIPPFGAEPKKSAESNL